jgi:hypothetical protein
MNKLRSISAKRFGVLAVLAGGLVAAVLGLAGPVHADLSDVVWANQSNQRAYVPHVDTSVHQSR